MELLFDISMPITSCATEYQKDCEYRYVDIDVCPYSIIYTFTNNWARTMMFRKSSTSDWTLSWKIGINSERTTFSKGTARVNLSTLSPHLLLITSSTVSLWFGQSLDRAVEWSLDPQEAHMLRWLTLGFAFRSSLALRPLAFFLFSSLLSDDVGFLFLPTAAKKRRKQSRTVKSLAGCLPRSFCT